MKLWCLRPRSRIAPLIHATSSFCIGVSVLLSSCASPPLQKLVSSDELKSEVPTDFRQQMDAKDIPVVDVQSSRKSEESQPIETSKKGVKKGRVVKVGREKNDSHSSGLSKSTVAGAGVDFFVPRQMALNPILIGEKHIFDVSYLGVVAGDCDMEVAPFKEIEGRKVYHIKGVSRSGPVFSMIYRINDEMESFFDAESLASYRFHIMFNESRFTGDAIQLVEPRKKKTFFWSRTNHTSNGFKEKKYEEDTTGWVVDSFAAVYFIRTLELKDGDIIKFPLVSEGKQLEGRVQVLGRESFDAPFGKVRAIKMKIDADYQGRFKKRGDSFLWLTDDEKRYVLRMDASVKLGSVRANLRQIIPGTGKIEMSSQYRERSQALKGGAPEL